MARNIASRGWLGVIVTVVVLGGIAVVAVWTSLSGSTNPDYQVSNENPGMGEYFVNLWVDPNPPSTGEVEFRSRLTSSIGSTRDVERLEFALVPPGGEEPVALDTGQEVEDDSPIYVANATLDQPGTWRVQVTYSFGGPDMTDEFEVDVTE